MQTSQRPQSRPSIYSWWSDSNPGLHGPTMNIHTAAKPLMRFMYHRQALDFVKRNQGVGLSTETVEIYSTYLSYKHILPSTKAAVLKELYDRAEVQSDAWAMVESESPILSEVPVLLASPDAEVRKWTCWMVGRLAYHESTAPAILRDVSCTSLVSLLRRGDEAAVYALSRISHWPDGAQAATDAHVLHYIPRLLRSANAEVRRWTCWLVGSLASYEPAKPEIFESHVLIQLFELIGRIAVGPTGRQVPCQNEDILNYIIRLILRWNNSEAICVLSQIARWPHGAQALLQNGSALVYVAKWLQSSEPHFRKWSCILVGNLAQHDSTAPAIVKSNPRSDLVCLLPDNLEVVEKAVYTLSQISEWSLAVGALNAKAAEYLLELLDSQNTQICVGACALIKRVASHDVFVPAILEINPCGRLLSLLRNGDVFVTEAAIRTLHQIAMSAEGAQAVVDANGLSYLVELLESPNAAIQESCRKILTKLTGEVGSITILAHSHQSS
ncbi:armadillo-type protein [Mycena galericulata]|nr:armadillo-type protein [Mycena galericulata]